MSLKLAIPTQEFFASQAAKYEADAKWWDQMAIELGSKWQEFCLEMAKEVRRMARRNATRAIAMTNETGPPGPRAA